MGKERGFCCPETIQHSSSHSPFFHVFLVPFQFDETLRGKDPSWGVRDMEAIAEVAENEARLKHVQTIDMPSNNYLLIFEKVEA